MYRKNSIFTTILVLFTLAFLPSARAEKEASFFDLDLSSDNIRIDSSSIDTSKVLTAIVFDSMKAVKALPFQITYHHVSYHKEAKPKAKTSFEKKYEGMVFQDRLKHRALYKIASNKPELIDFYGLKPYDYSLDRVQPRSRRIHVEGVDSPETAPGLFTLQKPKKEKENKPWTLKGNLAVQFSQYYVTDNWHKGGSPYATFLTIFDYDINYKKNRWLWENAFDVKIGFYNTTEDTIRAFRVNNDVLKTSSRIGYQASWAPKLYYSAAIDFNTSVFKSYKKTNSNEVVTSFLSPTRCFFSLGLDYRHSKNTTVRVSPVAYKVITLLRSTEVDPLSVGLDSTQYHTGYPGYMIQAKLNWKFSREIQITSDFDLFSSYDCRNIEFDWETVGKFTINRYLSTRLSLIMRFDNTPKNENAKIQIQEQLSFGFSYNFQ